MSCGSKCGASDCNKCNGGCSSSARGRTCGVDKPPCFIDQKAPPSPKPQPQPSPPSDPMNCATYGGVPTQTFPTKSRGETLFRCCPMSCGSKCGASDCNKCNGGCSSSARGRTCGVDKPPCFIDQKAPPSQPVTPVEPKPQPQPRPEPRPSPPSGAEDIWSSSGCANRKAKGKCSSPKVLQNCAKTCGGSGGGSAPPPSSGNGGNSSNNGGSSNKNKKDKDKDKKDKDKDKKDKDKNKNKKKKGGRGRGRGRRAEEEIEVGASESFSTGNSYLSSNVKTFGFGVVCGAAFLALYRSAGKSKKTERSPLLEDEMA